MRSAMAVTQEIDDPAIAARELISGIKEKLELGKNSCGILYYDYEADAAEICVLLEEGLGIPVIGCSTIATLDSGEGYHEMEAMLVVLTADDCDFSFAVTEPITRENNERAVAAAYEAAFEKMAEPAGLILSLYVPVESVTFDKCLKGLSEVSGRVPVFGGVAASGGEVEASLVFKGERLTEHVVLLLISGNINPIFSVANVISKFSDKGGRVTRCDGPTMYEIDGVPFLDFLKTYGSTVHEERPDADHPFFHQYPFLVEDAGDDTDGVPYVRAVSHLSADGKAAVAHADVPQGSLLFLAVLRREDVMRSAEIGLETLLDKINEARAEGCEYGAVLCISCAGRHHAINPAYTTEGDVIKRLMPKELPLYGFYSYGEICPTSVRDGAANNCLHNASIIFCAI